MSHTLTSAALTIALSLLPLACRDDDPAATSCAPDAATRVTAGDLNGDRTIDDIYLAPTSTGDIVIGACVDGAAHQLSVGGMATTILGVTDANGDGADEIFYGDSTALSFLVSIIQYTESRLTRVTLPGDTPLIFEISTAPTDTGEPGGRGLECADTNDDGRPEPIALSYVRRADRVFWTRVPYDIDAARATPRDPITGTLFATIDADLVRLLHEASCGDAHLFPQLPDPAPSATPIATPAIATHPPDARTGIPEVDAILDAVERADIATLTGLLSFRSATCRIIIRDAGDLPACPPGIPDGANVDVFPEGYCEGPYIYEGDTPAAFDDLGESRLYAVYPGSPLGAGSDYAIILWPGGLWHIDDGRITAINHGCAALPPDLARGWQLPEAILPPPP